MKNLLPVMVAFLLASCASKDMRQELDRGIGGIPATQFSNARTIEEIRSLKPQAVLPLKIAVMPSQRWGGISLEEISILEKLGEDLKSMGFAKAFDLVPQSLMPACGFRSESNCYLEESRLSGARMRADAILFLNSNTVVDRYINPLSILNLTIVGMWFVPAHHREAFSVYEASLFDINNGYLYAMAEGRGEYKLVRPYMYLEYDSGRKEARIAALNALGKKLISLARESMDDKQSLAENREAVK